MSLRYSRTEWPLFLIVVVLIVSASGKLPAVRFTGLDNRDQATNLLVWRTTDRDAPVSLPLLLPEGEPYAEIYCNFDIPDSLRDRKIRLWLTAFSGKVSITVNENIVGPAAALISPVFLDIPRSALRTAGPNRLTVRVERPEETDISPVYQFRADNRFGIHGEILIEWLPPVSCGNFRYQTDGNTLEIRYTITMGPAVSSDAASAGKIRYVEQLFTPAGQVVFNRFEYIDYREGVHPVERRIVLNRPVRWTPASPACYRLNLKVFDSRGLIDQAEYQIGLRILAVKNERFLLNDLPFRIRGITYRDVYPKEGSFDNFYRRIRADFIEIKNAGLNAVRFPHLVPHPFFFQLADSLGLFLFPELRLWRETDDYFINDQNLTDYKFKLRQVVDVLEQHPALVSIGLGHELPVDNVKVQKFILIAQEYLKQKYDLLTYLSPLDPAAFPVTMLSDFYMVNKYDAAILEQPSSYIQSQILNDRVVVIGNAGIAGPDSAGYGSALRSTLSFLNAQSEIDGFFLESFRDWKGYSASPVTLRNNRQGRIYPYGLHSIEGKTRISEGQLKQYLSEHSITGSFKQPAARSNVFTVTTFIIGILFFLIYRNNFRLRDNLKRSLLHAHGFFVDLRDRRIIALLNSAIVGLFTNLQISVIIAAFFYYFRNDLQVAEALAAVLHPLGLYESFYELTGQPLLLLFVIWILFYFGQVAIAVFLKIFNIFSRETMRFRQSIAICHWAGSPLIFLLPVSLFALQIIAMENLRLPLLALLLICFFWFNFRLANGIRVLMVFRAYKVFSVLILTYCVTVFIFFAFLDGRSDIFAYLNLLARAGNLF